MLNTLRDSASTWVVRAFLGLLVLSFAVWGIGDIFRVRPDTAVATIGDTEITGEEFLNEFNGEVRRLQANLGTTFDAEQARALGFVERTLDRLTRRALFDQEVRRLGLTMTDDEILKRIQGNPAFRDQLGNFDRFLFEQRLSQAGFSEDGFVAATRSDGARDQLLTTVTGGIHPGQALVDAVYRFEQEKRIFTILTVNNADMQDVAPPTEAELAAYHEAHPDSFMAPEYRTLTFIVLRPEDLADEVHVSDDDIAEAYESRRGEFSREERRNIEQAVVQDEEIAGKIAQRATSGEDFVKLAEELAGQDEATTKLGAIGRGEMLAEVADAVFALNVGEISAPVQSPLGWHVLRVAAIEPAEQKSLDDVRDQLVNDVKLERAHDAIVDLANRVEDELAGGANLEEVAETLKLPHGRIVDVDAVGRNRAGQPAEGLPKAAEFLDTAFGIEPGEDLRLTEAEDRSYFVVRVDQVTAPAVRPLEATKDAVMEAVLDERRAAAAEKLADELAAKAREGIELQILAGNAAVSVADSDALVRAQASSAANLSPDLTNALYRADQGAVVTGLALDRKAHLVVKVKSVEAAQPGDDAQGVERLRGFISQAMGGDLLAQFRDALAKRYPVEVDRALIDRLFDARGRG